MTSQNRYKGFASLDALSSLVPVVLMLLLLWQASSSMAQRSEDGFIRQQAFDKLVSIADYTVKSGAAVHEGGVRYPNWVDPEKLLAEGYADGLREKAGLESLYLGMSEPESDYGICIYRIIVVGASKDVGRLFVCGG